MSDQPDCYELLTMPIDPNTEKYLRSMGLTGSLKGGRNFRNF
ncbi:MAG TPA: hypothetical protein VJH04_02125 [archaeon]|nr:hypothetical protein [archaeon]